MSKRRQIPTGKISDHWHLVPADYILSDKLQLKLDGIMRNTSGITGYVFVPDFSPVSSTTGVQFIRKVRAGAYVNEQDLDNYHLIPRPNEVVYYTKNKEFFTFKRNEHGHD